MAPGSGDPAPRSIVTTYDILGRKVGEDLAHGGTIYAWGYDANNRVTSLADPAGLRSQRYDPAGRLTAVSRGDRQTFGYGYDKDGNVSTRTWPDGTTLTAAYNADDRMTGLTVAGGVAGSGAASYTFGYDPAGRPTTTTYPSDNGLVTDRTYDRAGRLAAVDSHDALGVLAQFQLTRDPVGNPTAITTTRGSNSQAVGYTYDAANRVTSACVGGCGSGTTGKTTYTYDLVGNRTSQTRSGSAGSDSLTYSYDAADELTTAKTKGGGEVDYAYDSQGNQIRAGKDTFTYNLDHTIASATVGGVKTTYTYDAQGLQLSAVSNAPGGPRTRSWATDVNGPRPLLALETTATPGNTSSRGFLPGPSADPVA